MEKITIEKTAAEVAVLAAKALSDMTGRIKSYRQLALEWAEKGHATGEGWWSNMAAEQSILADVLEESMNLWLAKNKMTDIYQAKTIVFHVAPKQEEVSND
jgi:hypothetical protein